MAFDQLDPEFNPSYKTPTKEFYVGCAFYLGKPSQVLTSWSFDTAEEAKRKAANLSGCRDAAEVYRIDEGGSYHTQAGMRLALVQAYFDGYEVPDPKKAQL